MKLHMLYSITKYMLSDKFNPKCKVEYSIIEEPFDKKERAAIDFHTEQSTNHFKPKLK